MHSEYKECGLCPRNCRLDRMKQGGYCTASADLEISSWNLHYGEEPIVSGDRGSGTVFFTHCSMRCAFCQNYPISQLGNGRVYSQEKFIEILLDLQRQGAHNINLVSPDHYIPHIKTALEKIKNDKLEIPVLFNCSGYQKEGSIKELSGLIDIYMPDLKTLDRVYSTNISGATDYPKVVLRALDEMYRQTGPVVLSNDGFIEKGMIIRHLYMPGMEKDSKKILEYIAKRFEDKVFLSLMGQYHPAHKALEIEMLNRYPDPAKYAELVEYVKEIGLENVFIQSIE